MLKNNEKTTYGITSRGDGRTQQHETIQRNKDLRVKSNVFLVLCPVGSWSGKSAPSSAPLPLLPLPGDGMSIPLGVRGMPKSPARTSLTAERICSCRLGGSP